jgi:hypothetical protein
LLFLGIVSALQSFAQLDDEYFAYPFFNDLNILTRRVRSTYIYPKSGSAVTTTDQINYSIKADDQGNWISVTKSGDTIDKPDTRTITYY